jgi:nucleotide-binding universal stress UspA family protein
MPCQHILVPLDFSPYAEQALAYALELASICQARVTLLHVMHLPLTVEVDLHAYLPQIEAAARQQMETYQRRVQAAGLSGDLVLVHGVPFQEIIETAKDQQIDLIVMGTHGRTGLPHLFLGSVAEKVVRLAPCSVLVTRQPADSPQA